MAMIEWWFWPIVIYGLGILAAFDVIWRGRSSQSMSAWVLALLLMPALTLPIYLLFGARRFRGYRRARREGDTVLGPIGITVGQRLSAFIAQPKPLTKPFTRLFRMPEISGNQCTLLINGDVTFKRLFQRIREANHVICLQFYILRDDALGRELLHALRQKVRQGVSVYLLYDEIGSHKLSRRYVKALKESGITVSRFNPIRFRYRWQLNFRNHRKVAIIDEQYAFVGGHNLGMEYLHHYGYWRDTHVEIHGPAALTFQLGFVEDWYWATHTVLELPWASPNRFGQTPAMCLNPGPSDYQDSGATVVTHLINQAQHRCWLATPYFIPDATLINALQLAVLRGVDVRVLLPHKTDNWLVQQAMRSYVQELTHYGIHFHTYQKGFMHQKVILVDNDTACIGSMNLDNRSLHINFESSALIHDPAFAQQVKEMLELDFSHAIPSPLNYPVWQRLVARSTRLLAPIL